ncbi:MULTISPECIES: dTMP kinase [Ligilactobacillus]|uniref:Thymidylate kinase n=1 Tax=Ligilactobacillus animalis TaxID=1605 RepID=A0AAJ6K4F9_9LACO|nr:dTMP kinase [Ligilactobacillus animalis]KRM58295.1 thymidylate kinase [Ligilactobacillus animalis KCTC 3501 = DSM 20602]MBU5278734.1 dTMP kinase [Ligilactobacillus animalis]MDO5882626.1 dTMP kinase [Ligilactobacillus animalis]MDQ2234103.1 dTMP kinase [Ligilactobacillus animalis]MDU1487895.1 dTMP kinase [Ligilactobacillus animalis]
MSGFFITFEGTDGSGKTSVLNAIEAKLKAAKIDYLRTREPGGNRISEQIRNVILDEKFTEMDARTEALLYAAARRQHLVETVLPALEAGKVVLCDRFVDSSLVYQGAGRGIGVAEVKQMNQFATAGLEPDLTIYLAIEPSLGLERIKKNRQDEVNRLDKEALSFYETVYQAYQKLAAENERIVTIDASQKLADVIADVELVLSSKIPVRN